MKSAFSYLTYIFAFFYVSFFHASHAAMYVYPMEVSVGINGASQIRVISQNNSVQFIKVSLKQVLEPGTKAESETGVQANDSTKFIITPQKIALAAGSERIVRLVSVMPPPKETTWRAYFEGVNEDNFLAPPDAMKKKDNTASIGVNIVWGALIHVAPKNTVASLKLNGNNGKVINDGTIRILVKELGVCGSDSQCQWKKMAVTVYPDTEMHFPDVNFSSEKNYRIKYFNWITNKTEEIPLSALQVN